MQVGRELLVINLSSQSDGSDLLGGMKPVQMGPSLVALSQTFTQLLQSTYPTGKNADFLARVHKFVHEKKWSKLLEAFEVALKKVGIKGYNKMGMACFRFLDPNHDCCCRETCLYLVCQLGSQQL